MPHSAADLAHALGGHRSGNQFLARCPAHQDRSPSLAIRDGQIGPLLYCHAGCATRDIIGELRRLGLWDTAPPSASRSTPPRKIERPNEAAELQRRIRNVRRIWNAARDPRGTLVEPYLNGRGLDLPDDLCGRVLRFHHACPWENSTVPALIAAFHPISEPNNGALPVAIMRIALNANGTKIGKMMLAPTGGCAIKLDADEAVATGLGVGEGLETCLAVRAKGWRPVWCLGSAGGIEKFEPLSGVETLTIFADHDQNQVGQAAARTCANRWADAGAEVLIRTPHGVGSDWADVLP